MDDQASGLRQLFKNRPNQVIAFAGGSSRCGRTALVLAFSKALARSGQNVIVVDENGGETSALLALGHVASGDLLDALMLKTPLADLVVQVEPHLWAVNAVKAAMMLRFDSAKATEVATALITPLEAAANFVLIDSSVMEGGHLSLLSAQAHHMVIVVSAKAEAIQGAYVVIKRLAAERGRDGFYLAITGADSDAEADKIYENVRKTALRYLGVKIGFLANLVSPLPVDLDRVLLERLPMTASRDKQDVNE